MDERIGPRKPGDVIPEAVRQPGPDMRIDGGKQWWRKKRVIIPALILLLAVVIVAYYWYAFIRGYASTDDALIEADNVTISSKILGRVAELGAGEGDTVRQDQLLVRLDDSDLRAQEAQSEANLEFARKNAALARISLRKSLDDFNRAEIQFKGNAITHEQYDHARQAVETARAQDDAAQAQIGAGKAQLNVVTTQLANTEIHSPFKGIVAKRWVLPGDVVQAAQPILTVYNLQDTWVTAYFEETKIRAIRIGAPADVSVDAYPGRKFNGKVIEIGTTAASEFSLIPPNNASGNFTKVTQRIPVKIGLEEHNQEGTSMPLRAGMSVEVKVSVKRD